MSGETEWQLVDGVLKYTGDPFVTVQPTVDCNSQSISVGDPVQGRPVFVIWEWTEYTVHVEAEGSWDVFAGDCPAKRVHGNTFLLALENAVGLSLLTASQGSGSSVVEVWLEVTSRKLSSDPRDLNNHRTFLSTIVDDLYGPIAHLPFDTSGVSALGTEGALEAP